MSATRTFRRKPYTWWKVPQANSYPGTRGHNSDDDMRRCCSLKCTMPNREKSVCNQKEENSTVFYWQSSLLSLRLNSLQAFSECFSESWGTSAFNMAQCEGPNVGGGRTCINGTIELWLTPWAHFAGMNPRTELMHREFAACDRDECIALKPTEKSLDNMTIWHHHGENRFGNSLYRWQKRLERFAWISST